MRQLRRIAAAGLAGAGVLLTRVALAAQEWTGSTEVTLRSAPSAGDQLLGQVDVGGAAGGLLDKTGLGPEGVLVVLLVAAAALLITWALWQPRGEVRS